MRTLLLTFAATLLCAGAYAADPELYCAAPDLRRLHYAVVYLRNPRRPDARIGDRPARAGDAGGPRPFVVYVPGGAGEHAASAPSAASRPIWLRKGSRAYGSSTRSSATGPISARDWRSCRRPETSWRHAPANWGWIRCGSATSRRSGRNAAGGRRGAVAGQVAVFSWDTTGFTT